MGLDGLQESISFGGGGPVSDHAWCSDRPGYIGPTLSVGFGVRGRGVEDCRRREATKAQVEPPCEGGDVADAVAHAFASVWPHEMGGVTDQEDPAALPLVGHHFSELVDGMAQNLDVVRCHPG